MRACATQDRSFTFVLKTPPASVLLQKAAGVAKGSGTPNSAKVGKVTRAQLKVRLPLRHPAYSPIRIPCGSAAVALLAS